MSNAGMNEVRPRSAVRHCSVCEGVRVSSVEQGDAFVTLASEWHAGNGATLLVTVSTRCVRDGVAAVGTHTHTHMHTLCLSHTLTHTHTHTHTIWPFTHIRVVPAIVKLRCIHLGVLCGVFRDARHCFIQWRTEGGCWGF
jgi:hypothetical protein